MQKIPTYTKKIGGTRTRPPRKTNKQIYIK
jgi:hypothetical protein